MPRRLLSGRIFETILHPVGNPMLFKAVQRRLRKEGNPTAEKQESPASKLV